MEISRRKFMQGSMLALATASMTGCGNSAGGSSDEFVLNYSLMSDPKVLDATQSNSTTDLMPACNSAVQLTALQMIDGVLGPQPYGAESWEMSEDGLTWTFHLAPVMWEDDVPVTAQHYIDALTRIVDPELASVQAKTVLCIKNAGKIVAGELDKTELGMKAIDDKTLQVELDYYVPYFLDITYGPCFTPVRLDVMEKHGSKYGTEADTLISCGAFKVSEWVHDSHITLTKNEKYFCADDVKIDRVDIRIIKDYNSILSELYSGTIDRSSVSDPEWRAKLIETDKFNYGDFTLAGTTTLFVNTGYTDDKGNNILGSAKVRRAISACIDGTEAGEMLNGGLAVEAKGIVPITISIDGENFRSAAGTDPRAEIKKISDPKALFIEGLQDLGLSGKPEDYSINYLVRGTTAADKDKAEYLYEVLKNKIGVNLEIQQVESAVGSDMGKAGEFGLVMSTYYSEYNDPIDLMNIVNSTVARNYEINWSNADFDNACNTASQSRDHAERVKLFSQAEMIAVAEEAVLIPLYHPISSMMTAKHLGGFESEASSFGPTLFRTVYFI